MGHQKMAKQGGYWAVIPACVRRDPVLPANAKLLYGDISALTGERGYCYATNRYFEDLYGWTERSVQRLISALADRGYIRIECEPGKERRIYAGIAVATPPTKLSPRQKSHGTPDKIVTPHNNVDIDSDNNPPHPPSGGAEGAAYSLPLKDGTSYIIDRAELVRWRDRFPALDVDQQFRSMTAWLEVSPERRKTRRGIGRFICSWLSRRVDQNKPQQGGGGEGDSTGERRLL